MADKEAKESTRTSNHIQLIDISTYSGVKALILLIPQHTWQDHWLRQRTKLREIKNTIYEWLNPKYTNRRE